MLKDMMQHKKAKNTSLYNFLNGIIDEEDNIFLTISLNFFNIGIISLLKDLTSSV